MRRQIFHGSKRKKEKTGDKFFRLHCSRPLIRLLFSISSIECGRTEKSLFQAVFFQDYYTSLLSVRVFIPLLSLSLTHTQKKRKDSGYDGRGCIF